MTEEKKIVEIIGVIAICMMYWVYVMLNMVNLLYNNNMKYTGLCNLSFSTIIIKKKSYCFILLHSDHYTLGKGFINVSSIFEHF